MRGLGAAPESVSAVIGIGWRGIFRRVFVDHRFRDHVFLARPISEIEYAAALTAEWEIWIAFRIGGLFADWAIVLHVDSKISRAERPD